MASATYIVSVQKIDGKELTLRIRSTGAGDISDMVLSRSFVLYCFTEQTWANNSLSNILDYENCGDENWLKENLHQYIESTKLGKYYHKENQSKVGQMFDYLQEIEESLKPETIEFEKEVYKKFPHYDLVVTMADAMWLQGVEVGAVGESYGYDFWYKDPKSAKV
jgi:hypothetical protein